MDVLALEGMQFFAKHGYYAHEKENGGEYVVDIHLRLDLKKAGLSDQLEDTLNYELVYEIVEKVMIEPKNLIEHLAYQIMEQIAVNFSEVESARIRVTKLQPPLKGKVAKSFVELEQNIKQLTNNDSYWEQRAKY